MDIIIHGCGGITEGERGQRRGMVQNSLEHQLLGGTAKEDDPQKTTGKKQLKSKDKQERWVFWKSNQE